MLTVIDEFTLADGTDRGAGPDSVGQLAPTASATEDLLDIDGKGA